MTRLAIAEKKDAAEKIARVVGANVFRQDWFEGPGWLVTWCRGHLLEIDCEESKGPWSLEKLPIIPERFRLEPIQGQTKDDTAAYRKRLSVIRSLAEKSDEVVCCTDAGREGQLIFDNVVRYLGIRLPAKRLWISSLTEKAIRDGFMHLRDNREFIPLAVAARSRSEADWLVGVNATRMLTVRTGSRTPLSVGRVQTPTLRLICERYEENKNFVSTPFWTLSGKAMSDGTVFAFRSEGRFSNREAALKAREAVLYSQMLKVESVETKRVTTDAPLLHDIASLQKAANARYGYTAGQTLDATQSLYEKRLVSYPRTGSRYIPEDVFADVPRLLQGLRDHNTYGFAIRDMDMSRLNRRCVDATKLTDHHGLIITGEAPSGLSETQENIYDLILSRFIEAFCPAYVADVTKVILSARGLRFIATGKNDIAVGWKGVCGDGFAVQEEKTDDDGVEDDVAPAGPLPDLREGEDNVRTVALEVKDGATKPKPLYTDATLLTAMEHAGRSVSDESLAAILKGVGIGTPATRDSIMDDLVKRGYVERQKKKLVPTSIGLKVYGVLKGLEVSSVDMTAKWETSLGDIEEKKADPRVFAAGIRDYTRSLTKEMGEMQNLEELMKEVAGPDVKCPKCGQKLHAGQHRWTCDGCGLVVWREVAGKRLTDNQMVSLCSEGSTGMVSGFKSKKGTTFKAEIVFDADWKQKFNFPERPDDQGRQNGERLNNPGPDTRDRNGYGNQNPYAGTDRGGYRNPQNEERRYVNDMGNGDGQKDEKRYINDFDGRSGGHAEERRYVNDYGGGRNGQDYRREDEGVEIFCPKCGERMRVNSGGAFCANEGCGMKLFRRMAGKELSDRQLQILATKGRTPVLQGFKSRTSGKTFSAAVVLKEDGTTGFEFEKR